jgi:hypothetical protein
MFPCIGCVRYQTDRYKAIAIPENQQCISRPRRKAQIRAGGVRPTSPPSHPLLTALVRSCQKQKTDEDRCKFFLWDTEAHQREAAALSSNTRNEPGRVEPATPSKRRPSPPPSYTADPGAYEPSRKRKHVAIDEEDEYGLEQTDDAFNNELETVMIAVETPSKAVKTSEYATPSTKRKLPWQMDRPTTGSDIGLQTPQTGKRTAVDPFNTRLTTLGAALTTPSRHDDFDDGNHQTATPSSSSFETPTPNRFRNVLPDDLVQHVFDLLQDGNARLAADTKTELQDLLSKHAKNAEGFRRGRDVIRSTVKAKDAKITELAYRVSTLEAELEAEKAMVKHLQWEASVSDMNS